MLAGRRLVRRARPARWPAVPGKPPTAAGRPGTRRRRSASKKSANKAAPAPDSKPSALSSCPRCDTLRLTGSLTADERSSVASNASGIAAEVRVDRGSLVRKGDVLVQIDADRRPQQAGRRRGDARRAQGPAGADDDMTELQSRGRAGGPAGQGVGRIWPPSNLKRAKDLYAKKVICDRGVRPDADRVRTGQPALSAGTVPDPAGVPGLPDGPDQAGDSEESGGRHDDPRPVRRLGGRETGGRGRADQLGHAGHEGRHAGADRSAAAVADGAAAGHRAESSRARPCGSTSIAFPIGRSRPACGSSRRW